MADGRRGRPADPLGRNGRSRGRSPRSPAADLARSPRFPGGDHTGRFWCGGRAALGRGSTAACASSTSSRPVSPSRACASSGSRAARALPSCASRAYGLELTIPGALHLEGEVAFVNDDAAGIHEFKGEATVELAAARDHRRRVDPDRARRGARVHLLLRLPRRRAAGRLPDLRDGHGAVRLRGALRNERRARRRSVAGGRERRLVRLVTRPASTARTRARSV